MSLDPRKIEPCPDCGGTGYKGGTVYFPINQCKTCNGSGDVVVGTWWCNVHGREATDVNAKGERKCERRLGGIAICCQVVCAPMIVER